MADIRQRVEAQRTIEGQRVSFGPGAWWIVEKELENGWRLLRRGRQTKRISPEWPLCQEPFANLNVE